MISQCSPGENLMSEPEGRYHPTSLAIAESTTVQVDGSPWILVWPLCEHEGNEADHQSSAAHLELPQRGRIKDQFQYTPVPRFHDTCRSDQTSQIHALLIHDSKLDFSISLLAPLVEGHPNFLLHSFSLMYILVIPALSCDTQGIFYAIEESRPSAGKVVKHCVDPADIIAELSVMV